MRALAALALLLAACSQADDAPVQTDTTPADASAGRAAPEGSDIGETGGMCGGIAGFQCKDEAAYCAMPVGECATVADGAGVCTTKPEVCTMDYRPVCGCDGKTYGNACAAAGAGVSVAAEGECPE